MILGSFKTQGELLQSPPTWWPQTATLDNYTQLFSRLNFKQYFFNSTVVAVAVTAGNLLFCSMLGYALAMLDFKGKKALFGVVMGTLMIPGVVTFVPLFVLVANIGLIDSLPGPDPAVPGGAVRRLPDAAVLPRPPTRPARRRPGGRCGRAAHLRADLPALAGPALATLGILTFLGSWNNFLWPLVVAQQEKTYTLPVALALYSTGPELDPVRPAARRRHRRRDPRAAGVPRSSSAASSKESRRPESSRPRRLPLQTTQHLTPHRPAAPRSRTARETNPDWSLTHGHPPAHPPVRHPAPAARRRHRRGGDRPDRRPRLGRRARGTRRTGIPRVEARRRAPAGPRARLGRRHLAQPRGDDRPEDRPAGRQHHRGARRR